MNDEESAFKQAIKAKGPWIVPWVPFAFCVFLCGRVMFTLIKTGRMETVYPMFFCFLPMVFFFVAMVVTQIRKDLKRMSDRIDQLGKVEQ